MPIFLGDRECMAATNSDISYFFLSLVEPNDSTHFVVLVDRSITLPPEVAFPAYPYLTPKIQRHREPITSSDLNRRIRRTKRLHLNIRFLAVFWLKLPSWHSKLSPFGITSGKNSAIIIDHNCMICSTGHFHDLFAFEGVTDLRYRIVSQLSQSESVPFPWSLWEGPHLLRISNHILFHFFEHSTIGVMSPGVEGARFGKGGRVKVACGDLHYLLTRQSLDQLRLCAIIGMTEAKYPKDIETPGIHEPIEGQCHWMLPPAGHGLNLNFTEQTANKPWLTDLILSLFIQFILWSLAKLAKAIPAPAVKHLIMIDRQTMIVSTFNFCQFYTLWNRL